MLRFEDITPENWRLGLKVKDDQTGFVSNDMKLLARAYAYRHQRSQAFVIYDDETPIGMTMYYDCDELEAYDLSQLFIDERYQGEGFGLEATKLVIEMMRRDGKYQKVVLCYIDGNDAAYQLYKKCGFQLTGQRDGNEIVMMLEI